MVVKIQKDYSHDLYHIRILPTPMNSCISFSNCKVSSYFDLIQINGSQETKLKILRKLDYESSWLC
jgi:hypothetical protein